MQNLSREISYTKVAARGRHSAPSPKRRGLVAWLVPAALVSSLALLAACSSESAKPPTKASASLTVRMVRVDSRPLEYTLDITGSLVSSVAVDVKTEFAGRLVALLKQEGDRVRKGETLAQLDDGNARLAVGQARAALEVAQAALDRARVADEHARSEKERAENLLRSGGITDRDYQAAQVAARDAEAQVKLAAAQAEQAGQALALAQKHLNDCRITSPIDGEVERRFFNPGSWADGNALLYKLVDNQRLELETYVASSELARLAKGQKIRFSVAPYPGEEFTASILTISPGVQLQNRSVRVRAAVPNPAGKLKSGMFVKGGMVTGMQPAAMVVPPEAVWRRVGQAPFVFVAEGNRVRRREVKTGVEQAQGIEIREGLKAGELVVTEQNLELADGVNVTPRP